MQDADRLPGKHKHLPAPPSPASVSSDPDANDHLRITDAQPDAYWSGRFMSILDRFRSEQLRADTIEDLTQWQNARIGVLLKSPPPAPAPARSTIANSLRIPVRVGGIAYSSTTSALHKLAGIGGGSSANLSKAPAPAAGKSTAKPPLTSSTTASNPKTSTALSKEQIERLEQLVDDERRELRVFKHLAAQCDTSEARKSLWEWQLGYARGTNKEAFLPAGGKMKGGPTTLASDAAAPEGEKGGRGTAGMAGLGLGLPRWMGGDGGKFGKRGSIVCPKRDLE